MMNIIHKTEKINVKHRSLMNDNLIRKRVEKIKLFQTRS
jgi:hypothetical protein